MKTLENIQIGDIFHGNDVSTFNGRHWVKIYEILDMEPISLRFGKPDRIVTVKITSSDTGNIIDYSVKIWVSQLY